MHFGLWCVVVLAFRLVVVVKECGVTPVVCSEWQCLPTARYRASDGCDDLEQRASLKCLKGSDNDWIGILD